MRKPIPENLKSQLQKRINELARDEQFKKKIDDELNYLTPQQMIDNAASLSKREQTPQSLPPTQNTRGLLRNPLISPKPTESLPPTRGGATHPLKANALNKRSSNKEK